VNSVSSVDRPQGAEARSRLHGMWAAVAPAWGEHVDYIEARSAALSERMLELAKIVPGSRVLELACGAGGLGVLAAERALPDGEVVVSDVVAEMTSIAAARVAARELPNVSTRVLDLEDIDEPDESYDVVLCREGLMFAHDPRRAASEIVRVLRRGGRFVAAVWGPRAKNPWLGAVLDAASEQLGKPVPPPGIPGPFSLSDETALCEILTKGGLSDVRIEEVTVPTRAASFDEWWNRTCSLAGPLAAILASLDEAPKRELRRRAQERSRAYETDSGLDFPASTFVAVGCKA
jgi:enediyne biosynthesis protein CalE5